MNARGLRFGGRIDRYVGSLFLSSYATAFLLVVGLFLILDLASNIDEYVEPWPDGSRAPALLIVTFYLLKVPFVFLQVGPFVTLVAGLFTVSKLLKHNETIAALAAGVSAQRLLAPVFLGAATSALLMFALRELASFRLANKRDAVQYVLDHKQYDRVYPYLWLRDLNGNQVLLKEFRPATGAPPVAEVRGLDATLRSVEDWSRTTADRAIFVEREGVRGWKLENGLRRELRGDEATGQKSEPIEMLEGFEFTPELALTFARAEANPLDLSFAVVRDLGRRDPDDVRYQTLFQYHLTFPLANVVLLLVGLPILLRHERGRGAEGLAAGCLLCIFYFGADFVLRDLGLRGNLDPLFAAWIPILLFGSLGLVMFDSMRS